MSDFSLLQELLEWKRKRVDQLMMEVYQLMQLQTLLALAIQQMSVIDTTSSVSDNTKSVNDAATGSNEDDKVESPAMNFGADDYLFSCKKNKGAMSSVASDILCKLRHGHV